MKYCGFSLVEISIAIVILGLVAGSFAAIAKLSTAFTNSHEMLEKLVKENARLINLLNQKTHTPSNLNSFCKTYEIKCANSQSSRQSNITSEILGISLPATPKDGQWLRL